MGVRGPIITIYRFNSFIHLVNSSKLLRMIIHASPGEWIVLWSVSREYDSKGSSLINRLSLLPSLLCTQFYVTLFSHNFWRTFAYFLSITLYCIQLTPFRLDYQQLLCSHWHKIPTSIFDGCCDGTTRRSICNASHTSPHTRTHTLSALPTPQNGGAPILNQKPITSSTCRQPMCQKRNR